MSRILIAGCGDIGTKLGLRLARKGHEILGIRRNHHKIPPPIKPLGVDLSVAESLEILPKQLDWVFIILTADHFDDQSYRKSYVEGTGNLLDFLIKRNENPERIVFVSSTSVYGQTNGEWVDEESVTVPLHFSGRRILEAEKLLLDSHFPTTCIRFAGIYGPNRTRFIEGVMNRKLVCRPNSKVVRNLIHREDVIGILYHLLSVPNPLQIYNAVDNEPVSYPDLIQWVSERLGIEPLITLSKENPESSRGSTNKRCRNVRIIQTGYSFIYPSYREGYGEIIDRLRKNL